MDQVTLVKNQYRLEQWTKQIQECRSSGMKVDDWCDANGVIRHAYIATGYTDMRKSIDGLATVVQQQFKQDLFKLALFLFAVKDVIV